MNRPGGTKRGKWYGPWSSYFKSLLDERKLNEWDFARMARESQTSIWQYCNGDINAPLKKLAVFSEKLQLEDAERAKFYRLARLSHTPPEIVAEYNELRRAHDTLQAQLAALRQVLEDRGVDLSHIG